MLTGGDTTLGIVEFRGTDAAGPVGWYGTVLVTVTLGVQLDVDMVDGAVTVTVLVTLGTHEELRDGLAASN